MLPADIARLRESTAALEEELGLLRPALDTLERERSDLTTKQETLEAELDAVQADLTSQRHEVEEKTGRAAELEAATTRARDSLQTNKEVLAELEEEEKAMEATYEPLPAGLQAVRDEIGKTTKRMVQLQRRTDVLEAQLAERSAELGGSKDACQQVRSKVPESCASQARPPIRAESRPPIRAESRPPIRDVLDCIFRVAWITRTGSCCASLSHLAGHSGGGHPMPVEWIPCRWSGSHVWSGSHARGVDPIPVEWIPCRWSGSHAGGVDPMPVEWVPYRWSGSHAWSGPHSCAPHAPGAIEALRDARRSRRGSQGAEAVRGGQRRLLQ